MESETCRVCNKPLFIEASIKRGIGPICLAKIQKEAEEDEKHD